MEIFKIYVQLPLILTIILITIVATCNSAAENVEVLSKIAISGDISQGNSIENQLIHIKERNNRQTEVQLRALKSPTELAVICSAAYESSDITFAAKLWLMQKLLRLDFTRTLLQNTTSSMPAVLKIYKSFKTLIDADEKLVAIDIRNDYIEELFHELQAQVILTSIVLYEEVFLKEIMQHKQQLDNFLGGLYKTDAALAVRILKVIIKDLSKQLKPKELLKLFQRVTERAFIIKLHFMLHTFWHLKSDEALTSEIYNTYASALNSVKANKSYKILPNAVKLQLLNMQQAMPLQLRLLFFSEFVCLRNAQAFSYLNGNANESLQAPGQTLRVSFGATNESMWRVTHVSGALLMSDAFNQNLLMLPFTTAADKLMLLNNQQSAKALLNGQLWRVSVLQNARVYIKNMISNQALCALRGELLVSSDSAVSRNCIWLLENCSQLPRARKQQ